MRTACLGNACWAITGPVSRATGLTTQRVTATKPITTRLGLQRWPLAMTTRWVALSTQVERMGRGVWLEQSMWKGGWETGMWRWGWRRKKTEVHVLNHSFFPPRLFGWWGLIIFWKGGSLSTAGHLASWSPELSAQVRTVCVGLWLVAPPGLVRLSVCPSAEPWLLQHPGPGPGHLARAQQVPPAALEEQLPAEVPHQHWLLPETGA